MARLGENQKIVDLAALVTIILTFLQGFFFVFPIFKIEVQLIYNIYIYFTIYIYVCVYICICVCVCVCVCVYIYIYIFFFFGLAAQCEGSQLPDQGSNLCPRTVQVQSLNHWTTREVPGLQYCVSFSCTAKYNSSYSMRCAIIVPINSL